MTDELTDDSCGDCGFDASHRSRQAAISLVEGAGESVDAALSGVSELFLNERPSEETWSPLEYVGHIRQVFLHNRLICEQALVSPERTYDGDFPAGMSETPANLVQDEVVSALRDEAAQNAALFRAVEEEQWTNAGLVSGMRWTLRFGRPHICHELIHHRQDIADRVAGADGAPPI